MAVTLTTAYLVGAVTLPAGYTNPTLPQLPAGTQESSGFGGTSSPVLLPAATIDNVDPIVGAGNMITDIETYITGTFIPDVLGLDTTKTINMNVTVIKEFRSPIADFTTGTAQYDIQTSILYVVTP
jgi:hypothetical protein